MAVGKTHCKVGVRIRGLAIFPIKKAGCESLTTLGKRGLGRIERRIQEQSLRNNSVVEDIGRVVSDFFFIVFTFQSGTELFLRGKYRAVEQIIHISWNVHGSEILESYRKRVEILSLVGMVTIVRKKGDSLFSVERLNIVAIESVERLGCIYKHILSSFRIFAKD